MTENQLKIRVAKESVAARTSRRRRSSAPWLLLLGATMTVIVGIVLSSVLLTSDNGQPDPRATAEKPPAKKTTPLPKSTERSADLAAERDDRQRLWVSPTAGEPIQASYLLPATQLILHVRIAELLQHIEGEKVLAALGPWGQWAVQELVSETGVELHEVETLLLGVRPTLSGSLEISMRLQFGRPWSEAELARRIPNRRVATSGGQTYSMRNDRACFLPLQSKGHVLVSCPLAALPELLAAVDHPALFPRELARVMQRTDAKRMATLCFAGKFLQISAGRLMVGNLAPLRIAAIDFLGDAATASVLSAHWNEHFFLELQSTVELNRRPHRFAAKLRKNLADSSDRIAVSLLSEPLHPYGRHVVARFPAMLRMLGITARSGEEDGLSVVRSYLPLPAGHNLLMATELLLNTHVSAADDLPVPTDVETQSVTHRLGQTTSLVFPQETLERALEMLSEDLGLPIEIAGHDLQLEGITKNQSLGLDLRDRPASEILLSLLERANPDPTSSGPSDTKQKLVYVIREAVDQLPGAIVVTTRAAASQRGDELPAVFNAASR